jgi:hypothetical protein
MAMNETQSEKCPWCMGFIAHFSLIPPEPPCHLVAGLSIPSYTAAAMKWGFTKSQGITILVVATVALIILMILVFRATSLR